MDQDFLKSIFQRMLRVALHYCVLGYLNLIFNSLSSKIRILNKKTIMNILVQNLSIQWKSICLMICNKRYIE